MATSKKITPGERVGKYILRSAEALFSADRWNYGSEDPRSTGPADCICCASASNQLVTHDYSSKDLFWLVDVANLKKVVGAKDRTKRCRFCSIIYQAFWSMQSGSYRLRSQLWAQGAGPNEPDDWESQLHKMPRVWSSMYAKLQESGATKHWSAEWYDTPGCKSCVLCKQDRHAEIAITGIEQLCAVCTEETSRFRQPGDTEIVEVRPAIPLLLRLDVSAASDGFPTLQVRHAGGATIRSADGDAASYEWKVYTHSSMSERLKPRTRLASRLTRPTQMILLLRTYLLSRQAAMINMRCMLKWLSGCSSAKSTHLARLAQRRIRRCLVASLR